MCDICGKANVVFYQSFLSKINVKSFSFQVLKKYGSVQTLKGVAMDGPSTNTGHKSGSIRYLEELLGRPLQWQICAQHLNELVFKHLFRELGKNLSHSYVTYDKSLNSLK